MEDILPSEVIVPRFGSFGSVSLYGTDLVAFVQDRVWNYNFVQNQLEDVTEELPLFKRSSGFGFIEDSLQWACLALPYLPEAGVLPEEVESALEFS